MTARDVGGPAFPVTEQNGANFGDCGMDLRDYFAAKAMPVFLAGDGFTLETAARWAYKAADEMLAERAK